MVRVLSNREANGSGGFNSECVRERDKTHRRHRRAVRVWQNLDNKLEFLKNLNLFFTILFASFFCRWSRGSGWKLLLPFPPLFWWRLCSWLKLFGSGLLVLENCSSGCQAQQSFHLKTPVWQKKKKAEITQKNLLWIIGASSLHLP